MELKYHAECVVCEQVMYPGSDATWITMADGTYKFMHHPSCPPSNGPKRGQNLAPTTDHEELFLTRACIRCDTKWDVKLTDPAAKMFPFTCPERHEEACAARYASMARDGATVAN